MPLVKYYGESCVSERLEFLRATGDGGSVLVESPVDEARKALVEEYKWLDGTETVPIAGFLLESYWSPYQMPLVYDRWVYDRWAEYNIDLFPEEFKTFISPRNRKSFVFNGLVYGRGIHIIYLTPDDEQPPEFHSLLVSLIDRVVRYIGADNTLISFHMVFDKRGLDNKEGWKYEGCSVENVGFGLLDFEGDQEYNAKEIEKKIGVLEGIG